ncbi:eugenol synthase 1 isoform X1 [Eucalyptus grandis]|uniref:eugenol synthase 1 isoform X1 n=1 Tax=Eucalyptus grandis TaxID=71139 RepID=UPI00192EF22B|nr:eugenol synthase 1 isoform X1 [Eucalyptus grandis]
MAREAEPSRILIFGGTGYIGKHIARASVAFGHPTCIYARPAGPRTKPLNLDLRREFRSTGIRIIEGELDEHEKIVTALKQVDIVISALAYPQVPDQLKIIDAIVAAGNIKRFVPSDFGCEEDKITPLPPFEEFLEKKRKIRRATEAAGIPFTFVATNCLAAYFINVLLHPHSPHDEIVVYGDGEANAVLNYEEDVGKYTIKVANDPRACNRVVSYRPKPSIISQHQLISLWEEKTGRSFKRVYVPEEDLVKLSQTLPPPENIPVSILHSIFVKGDLMSYEIDDDDLEVSRMYPEMQLTTIDQLLNIFLTDPPEPARAAFG